MTEQSNIVARAQQPTSSSVVSNRERSSADLTQAIHSPGDEGFVMERARHCLQLYYQPDVTPEDHIRVLDSFARALRFTPKWAVSKAFDKWERDETRRPSPGNIVKLANDALQPLRDELKHRERMAEQPAEPERPRVSKAAADEILAQAGFGRDRTELVKSFPMAGSVAEAEAKKDGPVEQPHWSERYADDSEEWRQIRAARDANPLVREAREAQARHAAQRAAEAAEASQEDESDV